MEIRENVVWMPAGWVFDNVLELVAAELHQVDPSLREMFLEARTQEGMAYLDLITLDEIQFRLIIQAAERAYNQVVQEGPVAFHDPSFYPTFAERFSEWKALLRSDTRSGEHDNRPGRLILPNATWTVSGWLFDMVLEHFATTVQMQDVSLFTLLQASRTFAGLATCDVRSISPEQFQQLPEVVGRLRARYSNESGGGFFAPSFLAEVTQRLTKLGVLIHDSTSG